MKTESTDVTPRECRLFYMHDEMTSTQSLVDTGAEIMLYLDDKRHNVGTSLITEWRRSLI